MNLRASQLETLRVVPKTEAIAEARARQERMRQEFVPSAFYPTIEEWAAADFPLLTDQGRAALAQEGKTND